MDKKITYASVFVISILLSGCSTPIYVEGGQNGGAAWNAGWAEIHCNKYGKHAVITSIGQSDGTKNTVGFECRK